MSRNEYRRQDPMHALHEWRAEHPDHHAPADHWTNHDEELAREQGSQLIHEVEPDTAAANEPEPVKPLRGKAALAKMTNQQLRERFVTLTKEQQRIKAELDSRKEATRYSGGKRA